MGVCRVRGIPYYYSPLMDVREKIEEGGKNGQRGTIWGSPTLIKLRGGGEMAFFVHSQQENGELKSRI